MEIIAVLAGRTIEFLNPRRLIIHIDTLDIAFHLAHEKLGNRSFGFGTLKGQVSTVVM